MPASASTRTGKHATPWADGEDRVERFQGDATGLGLEEDADHDRQGRACAEEEVWARGRLCEEERRRECNDPIHDLRWTCE